MDTPVIFGITGWKDSGKTTLVERLIEVFTLRGLVVSAVKHAHHAFDIDHPYKDSYKFRSAGARRTAIVSRNRWAMVHELREEEEPPLKEILEHIGDCDLVLVEGYKRERHLKIEARGPRGVGGNLADDDDTIVAIACHGCEATSDLPVFDINNVDEIADFIASKTGL